MNAPLHPRFSRTTVRWLVAGLVVSCLVGGFASCGGTTGTDGRVGANPATGANPDAGDLDASLDGTADGTVDDGASLDSGAFDVEIFYADRALPDVMAAPMMTGGDGASQYPWPDCPPWVGIIGRTGRPPPAGASPDTEIPASLDSNGSALIDDAGRVVPAPDGSACSTYGWLGSDALDRCYGRNFNPTNAIAAIFPPCNWCADAGKAAAGAGSGQNLYDLCLALYACLLRTGCGFQGNSVQCLCGDASTDDCPQTHTGACSQEELAASQTNPSDPTAIHDFLVGAYAAPNPGPGFCVGALNYEFADLFSLQHTSGDCRASDGGSL